MTDYRGRAAAAYCAAGKQELRLRKYGPLVLLVHSRVCFALAVAIVTIILMWLAGLTR